VILKNVRVTGIMGVRRIFSMGGTRDFSENFLGWPPKKMFHQSKCISANKHILSTTVMHESSSSFMYLFIPCYCDACLKFSTFHMGVKTLHNAISHYVVLRLR